MTKKTKVLIILYVLIMAALLVIVYAIPKVTGALTSTEILEYGNLQVTDDVTCFAVRNETIYTASQSGNLNYYVTQDTQVRVGVRALSITQVSVDQESESPYAAMMERLGSAAVMSSDYAAPMNGGVSYFADGYEAYFTPENMASISYKDVKDLKPEVKNLTRETTRRGEPVYKICDNSHWFLITWVDTGDIAKYESGNSVLIKFEDADIPATVYAVEDEGDKWQVTFETNRYYENFSTIRKVDVTVVTSDYSGILIPNKSITAVEGQVGVYVKTTTGDFEFTPIKIVTSDGEVSICKVSTYIDDAGKTVKTVEIYDEILKNPN